MLGSQLYVPPLNSRFHLQYDILMNLGGNPRLLQKYCGRILDGAGTCVSENATGGQSVPQYRLLSHSYNYSIGDMRHLPLLIAHGPRAFISPCNMLHQTKQDYSRQQLAKRDTRGKSMGFDTISLACRLILHQKWNVVWRML